MTSEKVKIFNGRLVTPHGVIEHGCVLVDSGMIADVSETDIPVENAIEINAESHYVVPGFIDIHVHGGGGHDFMDATENAFLKIAEIHSRYGTTSMLPTTLTSTKEELLQTLAVYEQATKKNVNGAQFLGMHLEGPYIAMSQRGAQDPRYIRDPEVDEYKEILSRFDCVKRWSSAPELKGALELGRYLRSKNILPAIAHTNAIYEEVLAAFENGYTLITHLYSAMSGVTRRNAFRYAGVIESAYIIDQMDVEIIADGVHVPAPLLKLAYKIKGPDHIALITDAMRAAGMPPGKSILGPIHGGQEVIVEDGVAKLPDRSSFAGSVATTDRLVRNMIRLVEVSIVNAIKMATLTPARILGIEHKKGSLEKGKDADIVLMDKDLQVKKTFVGGKLIWDGAALIPSLK
jgi:N-acetylglucosamine-6-phosphate deacetylase